MFVQPVRLLHALNFSIALTPVSVGSSLELVAVDILGPFPESNTSNRYILVVGNYFTKWMQANTILN